MNVCQLSHISSPLSLFDFSFLFCLPIWLHMALIPYIQTCPYMVMHFVPSLLKVKESSLNKWGRPSMPPFPFPKSNKKTHTFENVTVQNIFHQWPKMVHLISKWMWRDLNYLLCRFSNCKFSVVRFARFIRETQKFVSLRTMQLFWLSKVETFQLGLWKSQQVVGESLLHVAKCKLTLLFG